jgi:hypothetical protein
MKRRIATAIVIAPVALFFVLLLVGCGATTTATITTRATKVTQPATTTTRATQATQTATVTTTATQTAGAKRRPAASHPAATTATARRLTCPPGSVPNAEGVVCVRQQTIDCAQAGVGNGAPVPSTDNCSYSLDFSRWCGASAASYAITSPAGTFLVADGYEGSGLAFFRWSDGTMTAQQRVC